MESTLTPPRSTSRRFRRTDPSLGSRMGQTSPSPNIASRASETMDTPLTAPSSTPRTYLTPDSSSNPSMGLPLATMGLPFANPSFRRDSVQAAPMGKLSCVFTDIVDSTALWEFNSPAMWEALQLHNKLIRPNIARFRGYEVKTTGDGFHLVFENAIDALKFCICVQIVIRNSQWPSKILEYHETWPSRKQTRNGIAYQCLALRMGCHFGMPDFAEINPVSQRMDYYGPMVNRSSRVQSEASGGEIAVSDDFIREIWTIQTNGMADTTEEMTNATRASILHEVESDQPFHLKFLGLVSLKGVDEKVYITLICRVLPNEA